MAKTVVALYDSMDVARQVVQELTRSGFARDDISLVASDASGEYSRDLTREGEDTGTKAAEGAGIGGGVGAAVGGGAGLLLGLGALAIPGIGPVVAAGPIVAALAGAGAGAATGGIVGALVGSGIPDEEAGYYAEGVRRGGALVTVDTSDEMANRAADIMGRFNPVDIDRRASSWRTEGWQRHEETGRAWAASDQTRERERWAQEGTSTIPIAKEEMTVGKREVQGGGVRVHTSVKTRPVEESVRLRQERVDVERRDVNRPLSDAEAAQAFRERDIEVTERSEEPVVQKRARVVGEVEVGKEVEEQTRTIRGEVRETDVDVERIQGTERGARSTARDTGMAAGQMDLQSLRPDWERHYRSHFTTYGRSFDDFVPAYQYGYRLASDARFRGADWHDIEKTAQREWSSSPQGYGNWDQIKDAIREGWRSAQAGARV